MSFNMLLATAMIYHVMAGVRVHHPAAVDHHLHLHVPMLVLRFLFITHTTFTFMALIGVQILIGVVVNIGIMLVAHINDLRALRASSGRQRFCK